MRFRHQFQSRPTLHGSLFSVMGPGSEAKTELKAHETGQNRNSKKKKTSFRSMMEPVIYICKC